MILVDAHVHIHECFDQAVFFKAAAANFNREIRRHCPDNNSDACLMLTETNGDHWFEEKYSDLQIKSGSGNHPETQWTFRLTGEDNSITAVNQNGFSIHIIAGRQITTCEDLEVLSLGSLDVIKENQNLSETVSQVRSAGGLPVLPWGPGKWMGLRGKMIKKCVDTQGSEDTLFLGDNGNRPVFWRYPSVLTSGHVKPVRILPGTDPLPFKTEARKPGSFGFRIRGRIDVRFPAESLLRHLSGAECKPEPYGRLENTIRFFQNQFLMQMKKRFRTGIKDRT